MIEPYKGIAGIYEEIRPSYPEQLISDIISVTSLNASEDQLLEVGAGTGKATIPFAEKGYRIHAVELGEDMADILREKCAKYSKVTTWVSSFEEWICRENMKYDMIYSAQAFHWMNKDIKYRKCHELLKENGYLVLFWYQPSSRKSIQRMEIDEQVAGIVERYISELAKKPLKSDRTVLTGITGNEERKKEIYESGLFRLIMEKEYTYEVINRPEQYVKAMKSVPSYASVLDGLDPDQILKMDREIEEVIRKNGGYIKEEFDYSLYIARKR